MRLVIQRVREASVSVNDQLVASIGRGFLVLCGVAATDTADDAAWAAQKTARLRVFDDADGKMNLGLDSVGGEALVVSQFTLFGDCRKGNRPSYIDAAGPEQGEALYQAYVEALRGQGVKVRTGVFRAMMQVALVNDGPVTLLVDSTQRGNGGA